MDFVQEALKRGYKIKSACEAFEIGRASYYRHQKGCDDKKSQKTACVIALQQKISTSQGLQVMIEKVIEEIKMLVKEHPYWGYRKVHANLKHRKKYKIGKKKVQTIMRTYGLMSQQKKYKPVRVTREKPKADHPNQFWGTDMTKFLIPALGWIPIVIVMDWYTKKILGFSMGLRGDTTLWLQALDNAVKEAFPWNGSRGQGVKLISDNGSQPTSKRYIADCKTLEIEQIFTSYNNPKGNADTERMVRTLKEEAIWPYDFETFEEAFNMIQNKIEFYNSQWCHSALNHQSPNECLLNYENVQGEKLAVNF